jgi:hypothetical protein
MKKVLSVLMVFALVFSVSFTALAAPGNSKSGGKGSAKAVRYEVNYQKVFKAELNAAKKDLQKQKAVLNQQLEQLEAQYAALLAAPVAETIVDPAVDPVAAEAAPVPDAAALLASIDSLKAQITGLQSQIKQAINERFMLVKTMYSDEELAQFENAAAVIDQMYQDAYTLSASCVTLNNNIVKFDAPAYLKGGVTMVPLRAIAEQLGAEVTWNEETQSVNVVREGMILEIKGTTILLNGSPYVVSTEITCGRTYMPLRFLAESLGLDVAWDSENEIIDIDDEVGEEIAGDGASEEPAADETAAEVDVTDDGAAADEAADPAEEPAPEV